MTNYKDYKLKRILDNELKRQQRSLILIPSENYVSEEVLLCCGNIMTNKYAEGYPNKRWYPGCKYIDEVEELAINRLKKIFNAEEYHGNVQPHSGTQANQAAMYGLLEKGDKILSMAIDAGGHISHGNTFNLSGKLYNAIFYGVDKETELINYNEVYELAKKHRPKLIIAGASSYSRIIDFKKFKEIADSVNAYLLADIAHIAGLIVAGLHPTPVGWADVITSSTHKTLRGPRGGFILYKKELKNMIDKAIFPGIQGGPLMHIIAAKALCFYEASKKEFKTYQKQIVKNAKKLTEVLIKEGFRIVSGGTDTHLLLIDLTNKKLTGKEATEILEEVDIIVNKNSIPFDKYPPAITSGIRLGSPCVTSRGMKEKEMEIIASLISLRLNHPKDTRIKRKIKQEVKKLCDKFTIYASLM